ncbi:MAG: metal ABC transporter permease [Verrucomicrobia bacterium]|nr:metal ABC transporter permease [Verrucomicrobiota bacterium]
MTYRWIDFFIDPILRGPTIGCMLMCMVASLIGVVVFIRKKSLVGEALSHAAYPGLILGALFCGLFSFLGEDWLFYFLLLGAFFSSSIAVFLLQALQGRFHVKSDAALCFVLSSFLGIGVLLASRMQFINPLWYRQIQTFLYGQAATMTDLYIWIYGVFFLLILGCVTLFYQPLRLVYFDSTFAKSLGFSLKLFERLFFLLLILAVIIAMKSVGVVLLSGMFIAPALSARRLTHNLSTMFFFASFIGALSGFLGNYFSFKLSEWMPESRMVFPTGPMIVLFGSFICLIILLCTHSKIKKVPSICHVENLLKTLHAMGGGGTLKQIYRYRQKRGLSTFFILQKACLAKWVIKEKGMYKLSSDGKKRVLQINEAHAYLRLSMIEKRQGEEKIYQSVEQIEALKRGCL